MSTNPPFFQQTLPDGSVRVQCHGSWATFHPHGGLSYDHATPMPDDPHKRASGCSGPVKPFAEYDLCDHGIHKGRACAECNAVTLAELFDEAQAQSPSQPPHGMVQKLDLLISMVDKLRREVVIPVDAIMKANEPRKSKEVPVTPTPPTYPEMVDSVKASLNPCKHGVWEGIVCDECNDEAAEFEASKARAIAHIRENHAAGNGPSPEGWIKQLERIHSAEDLAKGFCELMRDCDALIDRLWKSPDEDAKEFERVMANRASTLESPATPLAGYATMQDKDGAVTSCRHGRVRERCVDCLYEREGPQPWHSNLSIPAPVGQAWDEYRVGAMTLRQLHQRIRAIEEGKGDESNAEDGIDTAPKSCPHRFVLRRDGWCDSCRAYVDSVERIEDDQLMDRIDEDEAIDRKVALRCRQAAVRAFALCPHGVSLPFVCYECDRTKDAGRREPGEVKPQDKL